FLIGFDFEVGADSSIGPNNANHVSARLFTESEMQQWTSNRLLLDQQAGANLHLTAHAERVDTLIPGGLHRARSNDLPVIIFRTVIDGFDSVAIEIDA